MKIYCLKLGSCNYKLFSKSDDALTSSCLLRKTKKGRKSFRVQQVKLNSICQTSPLADRLINRAMKVCGFKFASILWFWSFFGFRLNFHFLKSFKFSWILVSFKLSPQLIKFPSFKYDDYLGKFMTLFVEKSWKENLNNKKAFDKKKNFFLR